MHLHQGPLVVVAPGEAARVARRFQGRPFEWCYFGVHEAGLLRATRALGAWRQASIGDDLNRLGRDVSPAFLDWVASVRMAQSDQITWWSMRLASKSPLQTDFFLLMCYFLLCASWMEQPERSACRVVVVEDVWLRWMLRRMRGQDLQLGLSWRTLAALLIDTLHRLVRAPLSLVYFVVTATYWKWTWRRMSSSQFGMSQDRQLSTVALYTEVDERSFKSQKDIHDLNTGRLKELLTSNGRTVYHIVPLGVGRQFLGSIRRAGTEAIVMAQYIRLPDIVRALLSSTWIRGFPHLSRFKNVDFTPLFWREILREWGHPSALYYRLFYFVMRRVASAHRKDLDALVYPFENHPWEKMLCLAFREYASSVRLIGYQHTTINALELNYFLSSGEAQGTPLPDWIVSSGPSSLRQLESLGYPRQRLTNGGALRYEHLHDRCWWRGTQLGSVDGTRERTILVVLPISIPHSLRLLRDLFALVRATTEREPRLRFVVKSHPRVSFVRLGLTRWALPNGFELSERPLTELLAMADMVLYTGPTAAHLEAVFAGIPVVRYRSDLLDMEDDGGDKLDGVRVANAETLGAILHECLPTPLDERQRIGMLNTLFAPVDEQVWLRLTGGLTDQLTAVSGGTTEERRKVP